MSYLFLDVETTGLDLLDDRILSLGMVRAERDTLHILEEHYLKVKPTVPVSPKAVEVNGYTEEAWKNAMSQGTAANLFATLASTGGETIVVAHNSPFDYGFVHALLSREKVPFPSCLDYHWRCTSTMADRALVAKGRIPYPSMRRICEVFGISTEGQHNALVDAHLCLKVFAHLRALEAGAIRIPDPM